MSRIFATLCTLCFLHAAARPLAAAVTVQQYHIHDFSFSAQVPGNPFDVDLVGEFTGPGGVKLAIPAFYDGANTWKIRFAPTLVGQWSMRTISSVAPLNGRTDAAITTTANTNPSIHGGLLVDPLHRHHFVYEDGTRYFLMGYEADWLGEADMKDPERKVMHRLIDQIAARGFNHVLVNVYAHDTSWSRGHMNEWDYGPPALYVFGGTNEAPDHARMNTDYFKIYDGMMQALQDKGLVANVMLKVYNKMVKWPQAGSKDEERYFKYVTARYQAYSNVTWDFSKEQNNEHDKDLEHRLIDLIRATDAYHRLTTTHTMDRYFWDSRLSRNIDFVTDQEHNRWMEKALFDRQVHQWPYMNSELYYERGVDDLPTYPVKQDWQEVIRGAYEVYLSGGYFAYYYSNTAWDLVKPDPEPPGMARFQILKDALSTLPYWVMEPRPELAIGGPCLAIPGQVYAFYVTPPLPRGAGSGPGGGGLGLLGDITVNLTNLPGEAALQWINTWTGEHVEDSVSKPGVHQLKRPAAFGTAPALLIVRNTSSFGLAQDRLAPNALPPSDRPFGSLRDQATMQQAWLKKRLDAFLPALMRKHGIDLWVVPMREYNEDPVFLAIAAPETFAARRRTIYVFFDKCAAAGAPASPACVERIALGGTSQGGIFDARTSAKAIDAAVGGRQAELWGDEQWLLLKQVVEERKPRVIGIDRSTVFAFSDGLSSGELQGMSEALGATWTSKFRDAERLPLELIASRLPEEEAFFEKLTALVWQMTQTMFSESVIVPGTTRTSDLVWWWRQRTNDQGLGTWFQPSVNVQRKGATAKEIGDDPIVQAGDVLHCDVGLTVARLNTDTQHLAYVLRPGETDAPAGLKQALANANAMQDFAMEEIRPGRTGNEILGSVLARMKAKGITGTMYSHPIGLNGHGAGPLIGLWDYQDGVVGRGDARVIPSMWFSVELQATTPVPEWDGQPVQMAQEEDMIIGADGKSRWARQRQDRLFLVRGAR